MTPTIIIAEAGVNHNGNLARALDMVLAAKSAGADIIKFQAFITENTVSAAAPTAAYQARNTGAQNQSDLIRVLELSWSDFEALAKACGSAGIGFLATPFDWMMTERLLGLGMQAIKVGSGEITNTVALEHFASFGVPVWLSTGMSTLDEVGQAIATLDRAGCSDITVMHCTSIYPASADLLNLKALTTMQAAFHRPIGYSDHSLGDQAALAAVALGAEVIEKHFTLDRALEGPDHAASLDPPELTLMVTRIRELEAMLGTGEKVPMGEEPDTAKLVRRSWHTSKPLPAGHILEAGDLKLIRPASGLQPSVSPVGRVLKSPLGAMEPVTEDGLV